jgi:antitoxin component of MazEF toxin-antitoxin module
MNEDTLVTLERAAELFSSPERRVSPMQVAALLVENAAEALAEQIDRND